MMGLKLLDILLTLLHLVIVGFNLLGWIWKRTQKLHFICVLVTAACWFLLGIWYGIGYCPITDWQWQIKAKLGEANLPDSFITYLVRNIVGIDISSSVIDVCTAGGFLLAIVMTVYVNFFMKRKR